MEMIQLRGFLFSSPSWDLWPAQRLVLAIMAHVSGNQTYSPLRANQVRPGTGSAAHVTGARWEGDQSGAVKAEVCQQQVRPPHSPSLSLRAYLYAPSYLRLIATVTLTNKSIAATSHVTPSSFLSRFGARTRPFTNVQEAFFFFFPIGGCKQTLCLLCHL